MALKLSQGLRDALLITGAFKGQMDGVEIRIFSGTAPASPNDAETGTKLVTIQSDDVGDSLMDWDGTLPAAGQIQKDQGQVWSSNASATGTAGYFRVTFPIGTDAGGSSTTLKRLQGNVGTSGSDLNMSSVSIVNGAPQTIDTFKLTIPEG
jgi:hypothetical protein